MPRTLPHHKAVFVVDDDPSMLKGMRRLLRQYGFETVPFETAKALRDHGDFDQAFCIVLDVNLSDGSGIDCVSNWRSRAWRCRSSTSPEMTATPPAWPRWRRVASPI